MTPEQAACRDSEHDPNPRIALMQMPIERVWWIRCPACKLTRLMPVFKGPLA